MSIAGPRSANGRSPGRADRRVQRLDHRRGRVRRRHVGRARRAAHVTAPRLALHGLPLSLPSQAGRALVAADLATAGADHTYELRHPLIAAGVVAALDDGREYASTSSWQRATADPARHTATWPTPATSARPRWRAPPRRAPTVASRAALLLLAGRTRSRSRRREHARRRRRAPALGALHRRDRLARAPAAFADTDQAARADLTLAHTFWAETRIDEARAAIERIASTRRRRVPGSSRY